MNVHALQPALPGLKVRKPRPALEVRTHIALADLLRWSINRGWWWSHIPSGELRTKATAGRLQRMGAMPGMFDLLFIAPDGEHLWLELKRKGGGLKASQKEFRGVLVRAGVRHAVARSYEEAVAILTGWGVLRARVSA